MQPKVEEFLAQITSAEEWAGHLSRSQEESNKTAQTQKEKEKEKRQSQADKRKGLNKKNIGGVVVDAASDSLDVDINKIIDGGEDTENVNTNVDDGI